MAGGFLYNGIDYADLGLCVADGVKLPGGYSRPLQIKGLPASNDVWINRGVSQPVTVEFPCRIAGATHEALMNNLDAIKSALSKPVFSAPLYYFYEDRYHLAMWDGNELELTPNGPVTSCLSVDTVIRFVAQPNVLYNTLRTGTATIDSNPDSFNVPNAGTVDGNTYAPVCWDITNNYESEIGEGDFQLSNYTTGHMITFAMAIPAGYTLRIDRPNMKALLGTGTNYDEYEDVTDYISGDEDWCAVLGGVQNRIDVVGVTYGTVYYSYRGRFA